MMNTFYQVDFPDYEIKKPKFIIPASLTWLLFLVVFWPTGNLGAQPRESEERHFGFIKTPEKSETSKYPITEIIIKYKEDRLPGQKKLWDKMTSLLERRAIIRERRAFLKKKLGKNFLEKKLIRKYRIGALHSMPALGADLAKLPQGLPLTTIRKLIKELEKDPMVEYAEPNHTLVATSHFKAPPKDGKWLEDKLWGMEKIGMAEAWTDSIGNSNVIVAVLDSGIDYLHPDLVDNIWVNTEEEAGGEDGNNYDDDIYGVNFLLHTDTNHICTAEHGLPQYDPNLPMDYIGHGSSVAGIIAARGNYDPGGSTPLTSYVGVNWQARLMSLKMLCGNGILAIGKVAAAVEAIYYAVDKGAHVINASWIDIHENSDEVESLRLAIQYANSNGILFVTGAGNSSPEIADNDTNDHFPANFNLPNLITVAATNENDQIVTGTNFGATKVHLAAPGNDIETTWTQHDPFGATNIVSGTTASAAHVSGCAALLQGLRMQTSLPLLTPLELKIILMKSGDQPVNESGNRILSGKVVEGRRLNCHEAIHMLPVCGAGCASAP